MVVDVLKKLKKDAKARQKQSSRGQGTVQAAQPNPSAASQKKAPEPAHKFFVSSNWKSLLERKPDIAPKAREASASTSSNRHDGSAASNVVALDCEMVGVGPEGERSVLARVSIVDSEGKVLLDRFVRPKEYVTDFRTHITGITAGTFKRPDVLSEDMARQMSAKLLDGKIVVGHSVQFDFQALLLSHPHVLIRDTALFKPLWPPGQKRTPALRKLAEHWLQESIQDGTHDSVQDARIALRLYRLKSKLWEKQLRSAMQQHSLGGGSASSRSAGADAAEDDEEGERVDREAPLPGKNSAKRKLKKAQQKPAPQAAPETSPKPVKKMKKKPKKRLD